MDTVYKRAICMNVTTYESLQDKSDQLIMIMNEVLNEFLPYMSSEVIISYIKMNSTRANRLRLNDKNMKKITKMLLEKQIRILCFGEDDEPHYQENSEKNYFPLDFFFAITCNHASTYSQEAREFFLIPNEINISVSERLFNDKIPLDVQDKFTSMFTKLINHIDVMTGFITYETLSAGAHMISPFEAIYDINPIYRPGYIKQVRGYFWSNYLNENHIDILGGLDFVIANAPCNVKPTKSGVILQLTENINSYSDEQLLQLRSFLTPLFPEKAIKNKPFDYMNTNLHRLVENELERGVIHE